MTELRLRLFVVTACISARFIRCCRPDDHIRILLPQLFDADLTDKGVKEAQALNRDLSGGWFQKLTGGRPAHAVVSPMSRCLHTATEALDGLDLTGKVPLPTSFNLPQILIAGVGVRWL